MVNNLARTVGGTAAAPVRRFVISYFRRSVKIRGQAVHSLLFASRKPSSVRGHVFMATKHPLLTSGYVFHRILAVGRRLRSRRLGAPDHRSGCRRKIHWCAAKQWHRRVVCVPCQNVPSSRSPYRWKGIPYATPPVGNLRFKAPLPLASRKGVITDVSDDALRCIQFGGASNIIGVKSGPGVEYVGPGARPSSVDIR
jgi:hypothetical protein